jgi:3'-phosphoadenosine 5'-phosphosulfate sulfotransferase
LKGWALKIETFLGPEMATSEGSSNGNDIKTKRNHASIIGVFLVSKRNKPTYSRTGKDRSEAYTILNILCRIEEIMKIISSEFAGSKRK